MDNTEGLFVAGTDTDVGKSLVTCAIVRLLREQGMDVVGFKPVATGEVGGSWGDAVALHEASGGCEPIEKICPQRFALPLAPTLAAAREGIEPDMSLARGVLAHLCVRHTVVIVEGVGGILVPLDRNTLVLDFAAQIGFPVLVVCRAGLGTINHTLLTVREIERCRLPVAGIIMNSTSAQDAPLAQGAKEEIERISGNKVIAVIPYLGQESDPEAPRLALVARAVAALVRQVDFRTFLGSEGIRKTHASGRFRHRRATD
ncbi:MAG: dethiobiotin synthase [Planctomycetota bacterium]|nr:dethiobiotin synthase [Planctomycetota bacterium]